MAALAHIGIVIPLTGLVIPIVIWVTQKGKSGFVAFQALQALVYQLFLILVGFVGGACYFGSIFAVIGGAVLADAVGNAEPGSLVAVFPFLVGGTIAVITVLIVLYGIVGAIQSLRGKNFRYILIGDYLERRLNNPTSKETTD